MPRFNLSRFEPNVDSSYYKNSNPYDFELQNEPLQSNFATYDDLSSTSGNYFRNIINNQSIKEPGQMLSPEKLTQPLDHPAFTPMHDQIFNPALEPEAGAEIPPVADAVSDAALEAGEAASVADLVVGLDAPMIPIMFAAEAANSAIRADFRDTLNHEYSQDQLQFNANQLSTGQFGNSMHASMHASMLFQAQQQNLQDKQARMDKIPGLLGPVSTWLAGKYIDSNTPDNTANLNFNTAHSDTGGMVNPDDFASHSAPLPAI